MSPLLWLDGRQFRHQGAFYKFLCVMGAIPLLFMAGFFTALTAFATREQTSLILSLANLLLLGAATSKVLAVQPS